MSPQPPLDYDPPPTQQIVRETLPTSTLVIASAMYAVFIAMIGWTLVTVVDISKGVAVLTSDNLAFRARLDRIDSRQDVLEERLNILRQESGEARRR